MPNRPAGEIGQNLLKLEKKSDMQKEQILTENLLIIFRFATKPKGSHDGHKKCEPWHDSVYVTTPDFGTTSNGTVHPYTILTYNTSHCGKAANNKDWFKTNPWNSNQLLKDSRRWRPNSRGAIFTSRWAFPIEGDISPLTAASLGDFWIEALKHAGLAAYGVWRCQTQQLQPQVRYVVPRADEGFWFESVS